MRKVFVLFFCVMLAAAVQAQNIAGNVKDDQGKNAASASVSLRKAKDSSVVKLGAGNAQVTMNSQTFNQENISYQQHISGLLPQILLPSNSADQGTPACRILH